MSEESKDKNFSFTGDSLNESIIKSLRSGNGGIPPKVDVSQINISQTGQVVSSVPQATSSSESTNTDKKK